MSNIWDPNQLLKSKSYFYKITDVTETKNLKSIDESVKKLFTINKPFTMEVIKLFMLHKTYEAKSENEHIPFTSYQQALKTFKEEVENAKEFHKDLEVIDEGEHDFYYYFGCDTIRIYLEPLIILPPKSEIKMYEELSMFLIRNTEPVTLEVISQYIMNRAKVKADELWNPLTITPVLQELHMQKFNTYSELIDDCILTAKKLYANEISN